MGADSPTSLACPSDSDTDASSERLCDSHFDLGMTRSHRKADHGLGMTRPQLLSCASASPCEVPLPSDCETSSSDPDISELTGDSLCTPCLSEQPRAKSDSEAQGPPALRAVEADGMKEQGRCAKAHEVCMDLGWASTTIAELNKTRDQFHSWDLERQNLWLWHMLKSMPQGKWSFLGERLCNRKEWCQVVGVASNRVARLQKHQAAGHPVPPQDGRKSSVRVSESTNTSIAHAYFHWVYVHLAEPLAEGGLDKEELDIPCFGTLCPEVRTKLELKQIKDLETRYLAHGAVVEWYEHFQSWLQDLGTEEACSKATFYRTYKIWASKLRFREVAQHMQCADCCKYKQFRKKAATESDRVAVQAGHQAHLQVMRLDRQLYKKISIQSELLAKPGTADCGRIPITEATLAICIDGMDQAKFRCPRNREFARSKESDSVYRPQLHFTGAISHGIAEYYFVSDSDMRKDPESTIEMLSCVLEDSIEVLRSRNSQMPAHLWLQLDNTSRENKNSKILTWLLWLVAKKKFHTTSWEGMMVGHTHIDQDQRFSVCGAALAQEPCLQTPEAFMSAIARKVEPARGRLRRVKKLSVARDWGKLFDPMCLKFHGHTGPSSVHSFMFLRYEDLMSSPFADTVDTSSFPEHQLEGSDVIMLTKFRMSDAVLSQAPLFVCPAKELNSVDISGLSQTMPRNVISDDLKQKYRKMAHIVAQAPWNMHETSAYIEQWVSNNESGASHSEELWPLRFLTESEVGSPSALVPAVPVVHWTDFTIREAAAVTIDAKKPKPKRQPKANIKAAMQLSPPADGLTSDPPLDKKAEAKAFGSKPPTDGASKQTEVVAAGGATLAATAVKQPKAKGKQATKSAQAKAKQKQHHKVAAKHLADGMALAVRADEDETVSAAAAAAAAVPVQGRKRGRRIVLPPDGVTLGCSKCRRSPVGCAKCRKVAGVRLVDGNTWQKD